MNTSTYEVTKRDNNRIVLEEKIFLSGGKEKKQKVSLGYSGEVIVIRLDKKNPKGNSDPLFHFFEDDAKPWAQRCDFVIFQLKNRSIHVYCLEFKSASLPNGLVDQLNASEAWCRAVHSIINLYTGEKKRLNLTKFVFLCTPDPIVYLDDDDGYIQRDHTIKHYDYNELKSMTLDDLENQCKVLVG